MLLLQLLLLLLTNSSCIHLWSLFAWTALTEQIAACRSPSNLFYQYPEACQVEGSHDKGLSGVNINFKWLWLRKSDYCTMKILLMLLTGHYILILRYWNVQWYRSEYNFVSSNLWLSDMHSAGWVNAIVLHSVDFRLDLYNSTQPSFHCETFKPTRGKLNLIKYVIM